MLIIDFNSVSNYFCKISQRCELFISRITHLTIMNYIWNMIFDEYLQMKSIQV